MSLRGVNVYKNITTNKKIKKRAQKFAHRMGLTVTESINFPSQLRGLPLAEDTEMIVGVKQLEIPGIKAPYNPSIISNKEVIFSISQ